ncbi:MAG: hypothetical protein H6937_13305 [Burkholderiales bacterium]|nr:hypothetical protein [Burkholderiales bacterium]MDR4520002.1 hypothetical protein [Nitrosomonas sp.]
MEGRPASRPSKEASRLFPMGTVDCRMAIMIRFESGAGLLPPIRAGGGAPQPGFPETPHITPALLPCYGRENITVSHPHPKPTPA